MNKHEMFSLYRQAEKFSQRPSSLLDVTDKWAAYQFDAAVALFGQAIENASQETIKVGSKDNPTWKPRYTMKQLLDDKFRLPVDDEEEAPNIDMFKGAAGLVFDEVG